jgi:hypothetical protein
LWPDIEGRFSRLEVAPLRGDALRTAIEAPAFDAGMYLERGLVERLVSDADHVSPNPLGISRTPRSKPARGRRAASSTI